MIIHASLIYALELAEIPCIHQHTCTRIQLPSITAASDQNSPRKQRDNIMNLLGLSFAVSNLLCGRRPLCQMVRFTLLFGVIVSFCLLLTGNMSNNFVCSINITSSLKVVIVATNNIVSITSNWFKSLDKTFIYFYVESVFSRVISVQTTLTRNKLSSSTLSATICLWFFKSLLA